MTAVSRAATAAQVAGGAALPKALRAKLALFFVAPFIVVFFVNAMDRTNASFAALHMNAALGFSAQTYGAGASIFYAGYILFQIPHAQLYFRMGIRRWLFASMLVWSLVAIGLAYIRAEWQFYALRLMLGAAESGIAAGVIAYLANFLPRSRRGWATSGIQQAIPLAMILGGPLAGWLMEAAHPPGIAGWRWLFLVDGAATLLLSLLVFVVFSENPERAPWLTEAERQRLQAEFAVEADGAGPDDPSRQRLAELLAQPALWWSMLVLFTTLAGNLSLVYWLPLLIKEWSGAGDVAVGFVNALPWIGCAAGLLIGGGTTDRVTHRFRWLAASILFAALSLCASLWLSQSPLALFMLVVTGFCLGTAQALFWPTPIRLFAGRSGALGIAMVNACGSLSGFIMPFAVGWARTATGSFGASIYVIAGVLLTGLLGTGGLFLSTRGRAGAP